MTSFQEILRDKRAYYGPTEAAIEFAAEQYADQFKNKGISDVIMSPIRLTELRDLIIGCIESVLESKPDNYIKPTEKLLTIREAAKFLNLQVSTVYGKVHRKEIPVMKRSKRLYFSKEALSEYIKDGLIEVKNK